MVSCSDDEHYIPIDDDPQVESPVNLDLEAVPYPILSTYNFFEGALKEQNPVYGVVPYDLISTLFSDYAQKKRFVWMPLGTSANYINDHSPLDFPIGSVLIKSFYYDHVLPGNHRKFLETRLMIRQPDGWIFADYIWNDDQTEAYLSTEGVFVDVDWVEQNETRSVTYKIPALSECFACHNRQDIPIPIGPKPQNLNRDILYVEGVKNQLSKWVEVGYLSPTYPENIDSPVAWEDTQQPLEKRVRSYLDINCAHCHAQDTYCQYANVRFEYHLTEDLTNLGVCVTGDFIFDAAIQTIVLPGNADKSILYNRLNTTDQSIRMPLIARSTIHEEGVELIETWINSLTINCN